MIERSFGHWSCEICILDGMGLQRETTSVDRQRKAAVQLTKNKTNKRDRKWQRLVGQFNRKRVPIMISRTLSVSARNLFNFETSILERGRVVRMKNMNKMCQISSGRKYYSFYNGLSRRNFSSRPESVSNVKKGSTYSSEDAQRRAYEHYRKSSRTSSAANDRNVKIASYALAVVIGAVGATYAAVPLYKAFCQATGFGGTTQRVTLSEWAETQDRREESGKSKISQALWDKLISASNVPSQMLPKSKGSFSHGRGAKTWTDEDAAERLKSLRPVEDGRLITVRFDSTVGDIMPWSFVPTQLDVKVVPGETALSFFTATNHSDKAITGVATYNVHPPRAGLYFNKIQCFCFEEQRLLPGEQVDMPVFFFIDPEFASDAQLAKINNITLSYTFFQTDEDDDEDDEENEELQERKTA